MVALKFDPMDIIFSAGGAVAAMMILHFVHVQVSALSSDFPCLVFPSLASSRNSYAVREGSGRTTLDRGGFGS